MGMFIQNADLVEVQNLTVTNSAPKPQRSRFDAGILQGNTGILALAPFDMMPYRLDPTPGNRYNFNNLIVDNFNNGVDARGGVFNL